MLRSPLSAGSAARAKMHLVLDTNVVVSGFLNEAGIPGRILQMASRGQLQAVYSTVIVLEYTEVLMRSKFSFERHKVLAVMDGLYRHGIQVHPPHISHTGVKDIDDLPFFAAAAYQRCPLVTGNLKHFPKSSSVEIIGPADLIGRMASLR